MKSGRISNPNDVAIADNTSKRRRGVELFQNIDGYAFDPVIDQSSSLALPASDRTADVAHARLR